MIHKRALNQLQKKYPSPSSSRASPYFSERLQRALYFCYDHPSNQHLLTAIYSPHYSTPQLPVMENSSPSTLATIQMRRAGSSLKPSNLSSSHHQQAEFACPPPAWLPKEGSEGGLFLLAPSSPVVFFTGSSGNITAATTATTAATEPDTYSTRSSQPQQMDTITISSSWDDNESIASTSTTAPPTVVNVTASQLSTKPKNNVITDWRGRRENGLSGKSTFINFLMGMLGPGVLSLPLVFKQAGLVAALVLIPLCGLLSNLCMLQLVHCSQYLSWLTSRSKPLDYGGVGYEACANSTRLHRYKHLAKLLVNVVVVVHQLGLCAVSFVFIAVHLQEIFANELGVAWSVKRWMLTLLVPLMLMNFTRTLKAISYLSAVGGVFIVAALLFILQHLLFMEVHLSVWKLPWITDLPGVATAFGTLLFLFEGQTLVLPLENKLKEPKKMIGRRGVLSMGMGAVTLIYMLMGTTAYLTYGEKVKGSIALNLPHRPLFSVMSFMIALVPFFGFVLHLYVVVEMIWPTIAEWLRQKFAGGNKVGEIGEKSKKDTEEKNEVDKSTIVKTNTFVNNWLIGSLEMLFRAGLVGATMLIALAAPHLESIIPLVGCVCGLLLIFIFPAFFDAATFVPSNLALAKAENRRAEDKAKTLGKAGGDGVRIEGAATASESGPPKVVVGGKLKPATKIILEPSPHSEADNNNNETQLGVAAGMKEEVFMQRRASSFSNFFARKFAAHNSNHTGDDGDDGGDGWGRKKSGSTMDLTYV